MVIPLVTLGRFLLLYSSFQLVVHLDLQPSRREWLPLLKKIPQVVEYPGYTLNHESLLEIIQMDEEVLSVLIPLVRRKGEPVNRCFPAALDPIFLSQKIQFPQGVLCELVPLLRGRSQPLNRFGCFFLWEQQLSKAILGEGISLLR